MEKLKARFESEAIVKAIKREVEEANLLRVQLLDDAGTKQPATST
jgi:hypothetical protein